VEFIFAAAEWPPLAMDRRDLFGGDSAKGKGKADPCGMTTKKVMQLQKQVLRLRRRMTTKKTEQK